MDVHWNCCGNHLTMYVSQIILLYTLNLYSAACQLYSNKKGGGIPALWINKKKKSDKPLVRLVN